MSSAVFDSRRATEERTAAPFDLPRCAARRRGLPLKRGGAKQLRRRDGRRSNVTARMPLDSKDVT